MDSDSVLPYIAEIETLKRQVHDLQTALKQVGESPFRLFYEANPNPMWIYDLDTFQFLSVNNAAIAHYGYTRDEFLALTLLDIRPSEEIPAFLSYVVQTEAGLDRAGIWHHRKKDGILISVKVTAHTLEYEGRRAKMVLIHDVTEELTVKRQLEYHAFFPQLNPNPVIEIDAQLRAKFSNPAVQVILKALGLNSPTVFFPDDLRTIYEYLSKGGEDTIIREIRVKDRIFEFHIRYAIADGALVLFGKDITHLKQTEDNLMISERQLLLALEASQQGMFELDLRTGIAHTSPQYMGMLGYEALPAQVDTAAWATLLHPDDREHVLQILTECMRGTRPSYELEYRLRTKSDHWKWVLSKGSTRDGRLLGTHLDITERKAAETRLQHQYALLRGILESTNDAVYSIDTEYRYTSFNSTHARLAKQLFGTDLSVGLNILESLSGHLKTSMKAIFDRALRGERFLHETAISEANEGHTYYEVSYNPILDGSGKVSGVAVFAKDVTERKNAEGLIHQNEQRLSAIARFSGDAADMGEEQIIQLGIEQSVSLTQSEIGYFHFMDTGSDGQSHFRWWCSNGDPCALAEGSHAALESAGIWADAIRFLKPAIHNDYPTMPHKNGYPEGHTPIRRHVSVPVIEQGVVKLVVGVANRLEPYNDIDASMLQLLANDMWKIIDRRRTQEQVRKLSQAVEQSLVAIEITDAEGSIEYVNPQFCATTGYRFDELIGQNPGILRSGYQSPAFYAEMWNTIKAGKNWQGDLINRRKDGTYFWEHAAISPIFDSAGRITNFVAVKENITERKAREQELQTLANISASLRTAQTRDEIIDALLDGLLRWSDIEGAVVVLEGGEKRVLGNGIFGQWASEASGAELGGLADYLSAKRVSVFEQLEAQPIPEWPAIFKQVSALIILPIGTDEALLGNILIARQSKKLHVHFRFNESEIRLMKMIADLTARAIQHVTLNEQIKLQAQQLTNVIRTIPEGVVLLDKAHRIIETNPAANLALERLTSARMGGVLETIGDQPFESFLEAPSAGYLSHEVHVETSVFEVSTYALDNAHEDETWLLLLRDVTQERNIQEQIHHQERLAAVGELAAGIAHDFNNIMATIILYADMLRSAMPEGNSDQQRLAVVRHQAMHATNLIQQILDFSRRSVIERGPMDILPFLKELVKLWERTLPESIRIRLRYDRSEYVVNANPTRLQQAFMNLVVNARDAMPNGGYLHLALMISTISEKHAPPIAGMGPGAWVHLSITDNGSGIAPHVLPHIFEPFYTTKARGKGTGLGLAQVYGIVQQHDGFINVESRLGQGTTLHIYFPMVVNAAPQDVEGTPDLVISKNHETILVVEDDESMREVLQDVLESVGYKVLCAANGRRALHIYAQQAQEIKLVMTDMVMPEMSGEDIYHILRKEPNAPKILLVTGYQQQDTDEILKADISNGKALWLQKPFQASTLLQAIETLLSQTRANNR